MGIKVLNKCPDYDLICNHIYQDSDDITKLLINHYQDFVFSIDIDNKDHLEMLAKVTKLLLKYINDYHFSKELKKYITNYISKIKKINIWDFFKDLVAYTTLYEEQTLKHISIPKWF